MKHKVDEIIERHFRFPNEWIIPSKWDFRFDINYRISSLTSQIYLVAYGNNKPRIELVNQNPLLNKINNYIKYAGIYNPYGYKVCNPEIDDYEDLAFDIIGNFLRINLPPHFSGKIEDLPSKTCVYTLKCKNLYFEMKWNNDDETSDFGMVYYVSMVLE